MLRPALPVPFRAAAVALAIPLALAAVPQRPLAAQAPQRSQFDPLPKQHLPFHQGAIVAMLEGDVDRDGDGDLLVLGQIDSLYLRTGPGRFQAAAGALPFGGSAKHRAAALGDIDGDGDLDVVIAREYSNNFVYQNDGQGRFTDVSRQSLLPELGNGFAVALVDVDGDGDLDLLFGNVAFPDRLFRNDGTGRFSDDTAGNLTPGSDTVAIAAFDADGDGDVDLVRANRRNQLTTLDLNDGTGRFTDATTTSLPPDRGVTLAMAAGDLDGDGDQDLVLGKEGQPGRVFVNDGRGRFADASARLPAGLPQPTDIALADIDLDLDLDIVWTSAVGTVLLRNDGAGFTDVSFRLPAVDGAAWSVAADDVDGDGDPDLLIGSGSLLLYLNDGGGVRFVDASGPGVAAVYGPSVLADIDGDSDLDLVSAPVAAEPGAHLYVNDGRGSFADESLARWPGQTLPPSGSQYGLALADVDRDSDLDIVLGRRGQNALFLNDGRGTFQDATSTHLPADTDATTAIALGDVDGDGDVDLAIGNWLEQNRLYLNDGRGRFTDATSGRLPAATEITQGLAFADIDGDLDLDLIVSDVDRQVGTWIRVYQNDGTGRFTDVTAGSMPRPTDYDGMIAVADVDLDGDLDFAAGGVLFLNDGQGHFTDGTAARLPGAVGLEPRFVDLDLDGDLDLISYQALYLNDGTGHFRDGAARFASAGFFGSVPRSYAIGDVDRDGDPDVIGSYALYRNLHQHAAVPFVPRLGGVLTLEVFATPGYGQNLKLALPWLAAGLFPRPVPIPVFGLFHLDPAALVDLPPLGIGSAGEAQLALPVPNSAALWGRDVHLQALILHAPDPRTWRLTNPVSETLIR